MDYDGVRLDAPKHVYKEFFGLPNQDPALRDKTLIYNIQKNFNERRGLNDADPFDDMYTNDIRRDDALVYSEFFIGSVEEVDYWRNPSDPGWGIQTRYLDFPRKNSMIADAFDKGNLAALAGFSGFSPEEGVMFAHSHDEAAPGKLELAYAYVLTRVGVPVVYFSGNNLRQDQIGRAPGKNTWMEKGYDYAMGDTVNNFQSSAVPNLVYIHNQFARGREWHALGRGRLLRLRTLRGPQQRRQPHVGRGPIARGPQRLAAGDQTRTVQTSFAAGTLLKDYTGNNPDMVTVDGTAQATITVPARGGQGWVCYAPFNAEGPGGGVDPLQFNGDGHQRHGMGGARWPRRAGQTAHRPPHHGQHGHDRYPLLASRPKGVNRSTKCWSNGAGGRDINAMARSTSTARTSSPADMSRRLGSDRSLPLVADISDVPEGLHTVKARLFNGRSGKPALFQTFTETVYIDRTGPRLTSSISPRARPSKAPAWSRWRTRTARSTTLLTDRRRRSSAGRQDHPGPLAHQSRRSFRWIPQHHAQRHRGRLRRTRA